MTDVAKRIVDAIITELCDRSGLGDEWENCDEEIQEEIRQSWLEVVENNLKAFGGMLPAESENEKTAKRIVDAIMEELCSRSGLEDAWEDCDEEIQEEIRDSWIEIVANNME
jgi:hypothetical protein